MPSYSSFFLASALFGAIALPSSTAVDSWPSREDEHSLFQVTVPVSLHKEGGYPHKDALFGYPSYRQGTLSAPLFYANGTGCSPINSDGWERPFVLLIDRGGGCHFVDKVKNAQTARAAAVVIADHRCLCSDAECLKEQSDAEPCETQLPFMADDGAGEDITIPSMLIRKNDANNIKKELKRNEGISNVLVQFEWGIPAPDGRVEWSLWHSSYDKSSKEFLKEFASVPEKLGERQFFTPHYVSYNGTKVGCRDSGVCGNMCLNKGRYCLLDPSPEHDQSSGASGADIVRENLRRICIWKHATDNHKTGVGKKWWDYVLAFDEHCPTEDDYTTNDCANRVLKKVGISPDEIDKCMQPYGQGVDKENPILEAESREQKELQILRLPTVYVDGVHGRGRVNAPNVFNMICAGYGDHDPPKECMCADTSPDQVMRCVTHGSTIQQDAAEIAKHSFSSGQVMAIVSLIVFTMAFVGFAYWRRTQRHMRDQVRSILAEYMPLEDQSAPGELDSPRIHPASLAAAKSPRGFLPTKDRFADEEEDSV